jgi:hypothetical protein
MAALRERVRCSSPVDSIRGGRLSLHLRLASKRMLGRVLKGKPIRAGLSVINRRCAT